MVEDVQVIGPSEVGELSIGGDGQPRIVEAVATGTAKKGVTAPEIEQAMAAAAQWCHDNGVNDPDVVRAKLLEAREAVKAKYNVA